ncbi:MAG: alpha/beta fold hydrolase [Gemmatimonadaceae bacterium]
MLNAYQRFLAYRRSLPRPPHLHKEMVKVRGLDLAVFMTPPVPHRLPLVCVNGGLLFDHRLLWPALSPLATGRQLILYDQRGRGQSQAPPGVRAASIEHDAGDLAALRMALGLSRWDVLGHSWGGGIAMLGTERDRSGVRRLVLVDAVGPTSEWLQPLHLAALERLGPAERSVLSLLDTAGLELGDPAVHSAYARAFYPAWFADQELARTFSPPRSNSVTGATIAARLRRHGYDWRNLVSAVAAETLVIHGERDLLPVRVAHELVSVLPNSRLAVVPGAGHMPFWEAPEAFFASVSAFLDDT